MGTSKDTSGKRPIDRRRDAAISMKIDGESAVRDLLSTGGGLYAITETAVIKIQTADNIDPGRTNVDIPNLSQQVLPAGYDDEIVARILITAMYLFDERNSRVKPFVSNVLETCIELTRQLIELDAMSSLLVKDIRDNETVFEAKRGEPNAYTLPSIPGLESKVRNILAAADKAKDSILVLCRLQFLPDSPRKSKLAELNEAIEEFMQGEPDRIAAWKAITEYFTLIRNCRNASEHPREGHGVALTDFRMWPDGKVYPPLVEVLHAETPIRALPLVEFLEFIRNTMIEHAEVALAFIKGATLLRENPFKEAVAEFAEPLRYHRFVRFYRAVNLDGSWRILG